MTPELRGRLTAALQDAAADEQARAVLITGSGGAFCAGADIGGSQVVERQPGDLARQVREGVQALIGAVLDCPKPVIAAVDGVAAGIGAHLAVACDVVVAGRGATFVEAFVRRGLMADGGGTWLLPRLVGLHRAKALLLSGETVSAERAAAIGLVTEVVDDTDVATAAASWAARLADGPTVAMAAMKRLANRAFEQTRDEAFAAEAAAVERVRGSADAAEGLAAFRERRAPRFRGC